MNYMIRTTRGQYLRPMYGTATDQDVAQTLLAAASYIGYAGAAVVQVDNGDWVAYEDDAHEAADVGQGGSANPILVARRVEVES